MSDRPVVLVADDNHVNRLSVRWVLGEEDYEILEATDGREAVDLTFAHGPDLILMDLMMPRMDGLEATRILKERDETARIPILVLTALDAAEDRIRAFQAGVTGFLNKPFDRLELLAHVRSYVRLSMVNRKYVLSTMNTVTGLPNRGAFGEAAASCRRPWLFLVGMDGIDTIRRFYGESRAQAMEREYGEYLGRIVAEREVSEARLFHIDSGTFAVLYDDAEGRLSREEALEWGRQLHRLLYSHEISKDDVQWESDFTVVVSSESEALLEQAQLGMAEAERSRRTLVYAPDVAEDAYVRMENNLVWLGRIRHAVAQERFTAYYQPIVDNRSGEVVKYEALMRMLDEEGNPNSPGDFLLVAKNSKYYGEVTRQVFARAVEEFRERREGLSVNLSVLDIESRTTRGYILSTLRSHPDVARRLTIEIVEQEGLEHYDRVKRFISEIRELGATVALDDFGSGYSNFARVLDLDVDFVKIDGSIVSRICSDESMYNLVQGLESFVSPIGIEMIAEFVESKETLLRLKELGVRYSQGYHIGRPSPVPEPVRLDLGTAAGTETRKPVGVWPGAYSSGENSSLGAPQTGQTQSSGRASKEVPAGMSASGSPSSGS